MKKLLICFIIFLSGLEILTAGIVVQRRATSQSFPDVVEWGDSVSGKNLTTTGYIRAGTIYGNDLRADFGGADTLSISIGTYALIQTSATEGTAKKLHIVSGENANQIVLNTDGSVTFGGSANYSKVEADGTLVFAGDATVWDDMRIVPGAFDFPGVNDPAQVNWQPGGSGTTFRVYEFQLDDQAFFTCQFPHGYKTGENIYVHVHWTPGTRGNEESGKGVAWRLDYSWANIGSAFGASDTVMDDVGDANDVVVGTDHLHQMTSDYAITGTNKGISSMLVCRIYRPDVAEDTWAGTASGSLPILLEVDFHYPMDTVASRGMASK